MLQPRMQPGQMDSWYQQSRLGGLRRFALAITILNVLGHTWLGFEQSWAQPICSLAGAYLMELLMEISVCWICHKQPRFLRGSLQDFIDFFLPAHITGLACGMLLYSNEKILVIVLASSVAIASKHLLRLRYPNGTRHFLNPSNFGITTVLLLFPWVGISPPYHFTENLSTWGDWLLPGVIILSGSFLNYRFTNRWPLILSWLIGFVIQAVLRSILFDTSLRAALLPMSGMSFLLFSCYMVTDPPTTPAGIRGQILFGLSVAATYGVLMCLHIVFGLFFSLTIVSFGRAAMTVSAVPLARQLRSVRTQADPVPAPVFATLKRSL